jgi:hypothetical protein
VVIRILSFEGCPNCGAANQLVEQTVSELSLQADRERVPVNGQVETEQYHFLGSPTIQINGEDIEVSRRQDKALYACRVYRTAHGLVGVPPKHLLVDAIREAQLHLA